MHCKKLKYTQENLLCIYFTSIEIIKEAETNGDNLSDLLRVHSDQLEPNCLNQALTAAVSNDNHYNVGKLIMKGADKIKESLKQSVDEKKPHARAMLLLVVAAMEGNCDLIRVLFSEAVSGDDTCRVYVDDLFPDVQKALQSGVVSTVVAIEIARRHSQSSVREELLLKTDVNETEKSVHWQGLRLITLDIKWLCRIPWVQTLGLAQSGLKTLPNEMGLYLKEVCLHDCYSLCYNSLCFCGSFSIGMFPVDFQYAYTNPFFL